MLLSKSDYMLYLRQPAWLWLKKHEPSKLPAVDDATQAIFDAGHAFEAYGEQLFPHAFRLGFSNYDEYLTMPLATEQAIHDGATTIFQGRFEYENITCITDVILVVGENTVDLYEIKSGTDAKLAHEYDLAFQLVVLESCGYTVRNIAVIHANRDYVRQGNIDAKALTKITDVTDNVKARREDTQKQIAKAVAVMKQSTMPNPSPSQCGMGSLNDWLPIYKTLVDVPQGSIYDLPKISVQQIRQLEKLEIRYVSDIPDDFDLLPKQRKWLNQRGQPSATIQPVKIKKFLDQLTYPLYFLDYETLTSNVPYFDGTKPYQQIPFQYSLHILDAPGAELRHSEYLHSQNTNPVPELTKSLQQNIGKFGTVLTWNQSFEKSCNTLMGLLEPTARNFYHNLNERIDDLMLPFWNGWHEHAGFNASASIKNVLPVLVPELSYKTLNFGDGGTAQRMWMEAVLDGKHDAEREQILHDLTDYCTLDTLAMVRIFEHLTNLVTDPTLF